MLLGRWMRLVTRSSELVRETEALDPCPGWRARRVMAHALLPFLDSVALVVSLGDVLHYRSSFYAWFSSLLTPPRAATSPVGFFTWSQL